MRDAIDSTFSAKWEYRKVTQRCLERREVDRDEERKQVDELNSLGAEGWELVCAVPITSEDVTNSVLYVFKRRLD